MTKTTKTILKEHQIRKTKKQKREFLEYLKTVTNDLGYTYKVQKGALGVRNFVVGNPNTAKIVCTAHYDTCASLPFPNIATPKHISIYLLYQFAIVAVALVAFFLVTFLSAFTAGIIARYIGGSVDVAVDAALNLSDILLLVFCALLIIGPANKHNANDNTSGVTTLIDLMHKLPEDKKDQVAFVFFDLEEAGLIGSRAFNKKYKKEMKNKLLLNFDCVSDGNNILFAMRKNAEKYRDVIEKSFITNDEYNVFIESKGVFYPSDQLHFPCGVGVAALNKTKKGDILYCDKIHTKKDTIYNEDNIKFLVDRTIKLIESI